MWPKREQEIPTAHKFPIRIKKTFLAYIQMLYSANKYKMLIIVCILTFISWIDFMLSSVEHEKSFITSGPGLLDGVQQCLQGQLLPW